MKKRFSILLLLLTICFMTSHAQQMPITVTPILTPPYTPSLSKMCESGSTSLMVNVFVNDVTASDIQLRLHLKLESTGITIESVSKAPVRPISVGGGEARVLMGSDLADVLSLNNLTFKGYEKAAYIKTGALPGGVWRLTAWLEHYHTGRILSNKGTAMAVIASYPPPVLTSPKNNEVTTGDMSKPIVFTWNASKFMGGTSSLLYTLEMWEMHTDGVPAEAVVASQSPIYTSAPTAGLSHTLIPTSLAMEPGRKYCWRVTVSDPSGKAHIQNSGRSEVRVFQYLEKCPDICELNVTVRDVTATATWDVDTRHKGGWNVEMYDDAGTYHETLWTGNNNTGEQMFDYGTKWHVRVQGVCQGGQVSAWSEWKDFQIAERFTTPKRDDGTPYECGEFAEPRVITNMEEKELKKGDIFENERGTTKYEIYSATKNDDGSYRGLSYIILSIWNCKVLGEYDNLRVNTDGVNISNFSWRSVKRDLLMADPDAIRQWTEDLAKDIAGATYNNTIKDTIKLDDVSFETIVHKDGKYYAVVKTETGEIEEVDITYSVDGKKRVAIEGKDGKQLVIDKDGEVMGVEEYKYCGGSKLLLNENMKEKDAKVTKNGNVYFSQYGDTYLFDDYNKYKKHSAADGYAKRFPSIGEGDYRPAYACTESNSEIHLKAEQYKTYTFKNERGVPVVCKDGILTVSARGDRDTTSVYAYDYDGQIVGKVNVLSYDRLTRKICLVPIGNVNIPDAVTIKSELDKQFAQLMVNFEVTIGEKIDIEYKDKSRGFIHGGSGLIGVYNKDQESAISKLKETIKIDDETCYLFLVECGGNNQLDANDKQTKSVAGYMPRAYQFGFIYNQYDNIRAISHELCHGAFHLKHTFADGDDHIAQEGSTDNLMDYTLNGKTLNHWQWQDVHLPKSVRFKWLQDEAGAESISLVAIITEGHRVFFDKIANKESITVITPSGKPFTIKKKLKSLDFTPSPCELLAGSLCAFTTEEGETYVAVFRNRSLFLGYAKLLNTDSKSIKDKILWKADGKTPDCLIDPYTKELSPNDIVLVGIPDGHNCAINVFPVEYSKIEKSEDINAEGYNGSGEFANQLKVDLNGVSAIVVPDPTACFTSKYAVEYYESAKNITDLELKSVILRIATLMDLMAQESGGDVLFDNYKKFASKEKNPHFFGNPEMWGGSIDDYRLFEKALHSYLYGKQDLEELISNCEDNSKLTDYAWLYLHKYNEDIKPEIRKAIISKLARENMHGNIFFGDGQEYVVLKYIETIPKTKGDCEAFIQFLQQNNNMQNLCQHIDNVTNDNYTKFIASLTKIFCIARNDIKPRELNKDEKYNEGNKDIFIWCKMFRDYEATPYHNRMYSTEYENNQLVISQQNGFLLEFNSKYSYPAVDPFSWIYVTFLTAPDNIDESVNAGDVIAMPAFLFAWMCNEYKNQKIADYLGDAMSVASLFVAVGEFYKAVSIYNALVLGASIANLADVKTWIANNKDLGPQFAASWQLISCVIPDKKSLLSALKNPEETYKAIDIVILMWDDYVLYNDVKDSKEKLAIDSIVSELRNIKTSNNYE